MTHASSPREYQKQKRSKGSKLWITLSFTLSTLILGWAFSLPFQSHGDVLSTLETRATAAGFHGSAKIRQRRSNVEEFREAAIALDAEFMRSIRQRRESEARPLSGIEESRHRWERHVASVRRQLEMLRNAERGSVEWEHRQSLLKSLEDAPR